jgi:hypothetical protein
MDPHDSAEVQVLGSDRLTTRGGLQPLQEEEEAWKSGNQREVSMREQNGITTIEVEQEPASTITQHVNRQDEILASRERAEQTGGEQEEGKEESQTPAQEDEEEMYWKVGDNYEEGPGELQVYLANLSDETIRDITIDEVSIIRQCYELTGYFPRVQYNEEDSDCSDDEGDDETDRMWTAARQQTEPTQIYKCFKVRKQRDDSNPTVRMLEKDEELMNKWVEALQTNEFEPMRDRMLTRVTEEEAKAVGITPHVTDMTTKSDGRQKARINIDGRWEIRAGVFEDKEVLYAPAMDGDLVVLILTYAAYWSAEITTSDVTQAFTYNKMENADRKRRIMLHFNETECGIEGGAYFECNAVSYGTADASAEWNKQVHQLMIEQGYKQSAYNPCLYIKDIGEDRPMLVGIATDDFLKVNPPTERGRKERQQLEDAIDAKWQAKHILSKKIIGITIREDAEGITLIQDDQIKKIRKSFFPGETKIPMIMTPMHPEFDQRQEHEPAVTEQEYRSKLGELGYMRTTRYDVAVALSDLAQYTTTPEKTKKDTLPWTAAYIMNTAKVGIRLRRGKRGTDFSQPIKWKAWSDASWATINDVYSRYGIIIEADIGEGQGATYAKTIREKTIPSESAAAAELMAAVKLAQIVMIYRGIAEEIAGLVATKDPMAYPTEGRMTKMVTTQNKELQAAVNDPTPMMIDNEAISKMLHLRNITKKTKNLRRCGRMIQFMRGMVQENMAIMELVGTKDQKANPMTKIISSTKQHLMEMEYLMGKQDALTELQRVAVDRGSKRIGQRMQRRKKPTAETIQRNTQEEKEIQVAQQEIMEANTEYNRHISSK